VPAADFLASIDVALLWPAIEAAAEQVGIGVFVSLIDPPRLLHVSPRVSQIHGRTVEELVGSKPWSILKEADQKRIRELILTRDGSLPLQLEVVVTRPDGTDVPIELGVTRIQTAHGVISFGYMRDLTSERDAIEALRRSEARFRYVVEAAPDGVVILVAGRIVFINPRAARLLGVDQAAALGQPIANFLPPADAAAAAERIATMFRTGEEMPPSDYRLLADRDRVVEIKSIRCDWENKPAVLAFARDVTVRKALDKKLAEADRLTGLGTLAAGVAHEINNPLTYSQLSLQRIERLLADKHAGISDEVAATIQRHVLDVHHGITRVAAITSSLRMFARADEAPGSIDVNVVVDRALEMVANDLRHRTELVRRVEIVPRVVGNASRLEQVVVNLLLNALQSLREDAPSRIAIEVTSTAEAVTLMVSDTGRGIPADARERVFDPFFTTKPIGEGMGLGLAVCKTIVESFGGTITLDSTEGVGTTVRVTLRVDAATHVPAAIEEPTTTPRFRVLVVDDDRMVRDALARFLTHHHEVVAVDGGAAALAAAMQHEFDAIICDMMMPGIDGREVHRRMADAQPGRERRIVFITGGTFGPELDVFLSSVGNRCLTKPFRIEDVLAAVVEVASQK
jgi:PAS domain S-box-containing protein